MAKCDCPDCTSKGELLTAGDDWDSNVGQVCDSCYEVLADRITRDGKFSFGPYLDDYIKLNVAMARDGLFEEQFKKLDDWHSASPISESLLGTKYENVSATLQTFEQKCSFPPNLVVPAGVLNDQQFHYLLEYGYMWKDVGAGLSHGMFSHRLQWHVVERLTTDDFRTPLDSQHWDHSALELFTSLGSGPARQRGLWGYLFDNSSGDAGRGYMVPQNVEDKLRKRFPDSKLIKLIDQKYLPLQKDFKQIEQIAFRQMDAETKGKGLTGTQKADILAAKTDALWTPYYFARAGFPIDAAEKQTLKEVDLYKPGKAEKGPIWNRTPKKFSPDNGAYKEENVWYLNKEYRLKHEDVNARKEHSRTAFSFDQRLTPIHQPSPK